MILPLTWSLQSPLLDVDQDVDSEVGCVAQRGSKSSDASIIENIDISFRYRYIERYLSPASISISRIYSHAQFLFKDQFYIYR